MLIEEEADAVLDTRPSGEFLGRAAHQAPEVDGVTTIRTQSPAPVRLAAGDMVRAVVTGSEGVDLIADLIADVTLR